MIDWLIDWMEDESSMEALPLCTSEQTNYSLTRSIDWSMSHIDFEIRSLAPCRPTDTIIGASCGDNSQQNSLYKIKTASSYNSRYRYTALLNSSAICNNTRTDGKRPFVTFKNNTRLFFVSYCANITSIWNESIFAKCVSLVFYWSVIF